jgi:hypothetical protein
MTIGPTDWLSSGSHATERPGSPVVRSECRHLRPDRCAVPLDIIFRQTQPNFKRIYMYTCNFKDETAFDRMVHSLDLRELGRKLTCPHLQVARLCTPEDMKEFKDLLECPKEM